MNVNLPLLFELPRLQRKASQKVSSSERPVFSFQFTTPLEFSRSMGKYVPTAQPFEGQPYRLDLDSFAAFGHRPMARVEADLAFVAAAIYLADRAALRYPFGLNGRSYWRRRIHLEIDVSDANRWRQSSELLTSTLEFLTEDDWSFTFREGRPQSSAECQLLLWDKPSKCTTVAALFSGGLDSLAGAIRAADAQTTECLALISGVTHSRLAGCQSDQVSQLRANFATISIDHLQVDYGFKDRPKSIILESSQRSRAFIHAAFGIIGASMAGASSLNIYENGIGSLNLPLDATQLGSQNSRGTHPIFLKHMSLLCSALLERRLKIELPYQFATKAEVLRHPAIQKCADLLSVSNSCDIYPNYLQRQTHCGACPACIFRRMSLRAANLPDLDSAYSSTALPSKRGTPLSNLNRMEQQASVLRKLIRVGWDALAERYPALYDLELEVCADPASDHEIFRDGILNLYRRYLDEWAAQSPLLRLLPSPTSINPPCRPTPVAPHPTLVKDSARREKPAA
jgi:7-cyano-7-deazaguanine synthase in queuosine biosynthesis